MASTFSTNLAIELIGTGDQAGTWGTTTNSNLGTLIEQAISGYVTQAVATGTDTTITIPNGSTGVARNMYIELTGTGGASTNLIVPANKKLYFIFNNSTGAVTVKVSGQTGVSVPTGKKMVLVSNGTDIVNGLNYIADFGTNSFSVTNLTASSATITNLIATSGSITNLVSSDASATVLRAGSATLTHLSATSASITNLALTSLTISSLSVTNVSVASATVSSNLTLSGGTANGVLYLNGSKVATSGSALTFDGTQTLSLFATGNAVTNLEGSTTNNAILRFRNGTTGNLAGFYGNNSKELIFEANGATEQMRLTSTGLGIGTSSPNGRLDVASGNVFITQDFELNWHSAGTKRSQIIGDSSNNLKFSNRVGGVLTNTMTLDGSGNLGIGTSSPVNNANRKTLALQGAWGGQLDIMVGSTVHAQFGTDNFTSGQSCRIQSQDGIVFNTGGATERMRLDTSGNLGLGVTPSAWSSYKPYQVGWGALASTAATQNTLLSSNVFFDGANFKYIGTGTASYLQQFDGSFIWKTAPSGTAGNTISFTQAMTLDASANLIVNGTTPVNTDSSRGNITINGSGGGILNFTTGGAARGYLFHTGTNLILTNLAASSGSLIFENNGSERARITSGGDLLVGTTTAGAGAGFGTKTAVDAGSGDGGLYKTSNSTGAFALRVWNSGTTGDNLIVGFATEAAYTGRGSISYNRTAGLVAYNTTSDYRAKDIIGPVQDSGAIIDALKVYEGQMKGATQSRPMLVAHEAQEHAPYTVTGEKDAVNEDGTPKYQQMDVSALVPLLLAEIQSLRARVAQLETK